MCQPCDLLVTCPGCTPPLTQCQLGLVSSVWSFVAPVVASKKNPVICGPHVTPCKAAQIREWESVWIWWSESHYPSNLWVDWQVLSVIIRLHQHSSLQASTFLPCVTPKMYLWTFSLWALTILPPLTIRDSQRSVVIRYFITLITLWSNLSHILNVKGR